MSLTIALIVMTCIISYQAFENRSMRDKLIMRPASVKEFGEFYRFFTSGFIHKDWMHLIFNMYVLYILGERVEGYFTEIFGLAIGNILFLVLYLAAIIISSFPSYIKHQNNQYYAALGASGGTSAIVFAFILFNPWEWFIFPPLPGLLLGIGYLWYSSYMGKHGNDNIGHDAHLWGAIFGFSFMIFAAVLFEPRLLDLFITQLMAGPKAPPF